MPARLYADHCKGGTTMLKRAYTKPRLRRLGLLRLLTRFSF
jgi:hypothetical protein